MLACVKHARVYVKESITTTSGTSALKPIPGMAVSAGQGGAAISSTRGLALDLAPLRVNCVVPGLVDTELWDASISVE
jgi:NAD(P)-dependent dehydrogenase (short-subunit alcohol dehydrogenase family)